MAEPDVRHFLLPDIGEGLTEAEILSWSVQPGDTVQTNQIVVEVETAKAAVELPSPFAGTVAQLHGAVGDIIAVGRPIISINVGDSGTSPRPAADTETVDSASAPAPTAGDIASAQTQAAFEPPSQRQPVLVGYGPRTDAGPTRRRRRPAGAPLDAPPPPEPVSTEAPSTEPDEPINGQPPVLSKPPVRKLAKTLGVDLRQVAPTGPHGTVTRADVERAGSAKSDEAPPESAARAGERETRVPIRGVRRRTAEAMVTSAFTAPHVTEFLSVDVTATMQLQHVVARRREFHGVKLTPLTFVARAVVLAAGRTAEINSHWDEAAGEIVFRHYVNLGIAAATDRGLIVPNLKDADAMSLLDLARAISDLTDVARAGKTTPAAMLGGTLTITNIGPLGVDSGTPILNPGEAAIVAVGSIRRRPWVVGSAASVDDPDLPPDERIEARWVAELAVSFDHRLVDGAQGARFLTDVAAILENPGLALL